MTRTRPSVRRLSVVAALALMSTVGLSACNGDEVGAAALIDGDRLTISEVQERATDTADALGQDPATADLAELQTALVQGEIRHRLIERLATANGVSVSEAQIDELIEQATVGQGVSVDDLKQQQGFTDESLRRTASDQLLSFAIAEELGSEDAFNEALLDEAEQLDVTVNRRYGRWDPELVRVEPATGAISSELPGSADATPAPEGTPAPDATPTPSAS